MPLQDHTSGHQAPVPGPFCSLPSATIICPPPPAFSYSQVSAFPFAHKLPSSPHLPLSLAVALPRSLSVSIFISVSISLSLHQKWQGNWYRGFSHNCTECEQSLLLQKELKPSYGSKNRCEVLRNWKFSRGLGLVL